MVLKAGKAIAPDYRSTLATDFGAEIFEKADLASVNQWIAEKTEGKISRMLDTLDPATAALLVNAVYFKARWEEAFAAGATKDEAFELTKTAKVETPTMHATGAYRVVARPGYRAIRLPYRTPSLAMIIVLPDAVDGVDALARSGSDEWAQLFAALRDAGDSASVALSLPRFKIEYRVDLAKPFQDAGMRLAFQPTADFSGMFGQSDAKGGFALGAILHRAMVAVTEEGTEAAAATVVGMRHMARRVKSEPEVFRVDHPFLFFIVDDGTGAVLFQGRVVDPRG
jgi:serine protease inhibitor